MRLVALIWSLDVLDMVLLHDYFFSEVVEHHYYYYD